MKKDVQTEKYIKLTLDRREGNFAVCIASSLLIEIPEGNFFNAETDQEGNLVSVVDQLEKENQAERTRRAELRAKLFAKSKKHN